MFKSSFCRLLKDYYRYSEELGPSDEMSDDIKAPKSQIVTYKSNYLNITIKQITITESKLIYCMHWTFESIFILWAEML